MLFSLQPFTPAQDLPDLRMTVDLSRRSNTAALSYAIRGPMEEIAVPASADAPLRRGGLWEETCLEFFLAVKEAQPYWEVNLSPSGHWNVYRFSAYRTGMQEEASFTSLPFHVERRTDSFLLDVELHLDRIMSPEAPLEAGISAVIRLRSNQVAYWALTHPGQTPDFHRRDSFIARL